MGCLGTGAGLLLLLLFTGRNSSGMAPCLLCEILSPLSRMSVQGRSVHVNRVNPANNLKNEK
jgi:hypothetical protein